MQHQRTTDSLEAGVTHRHLGPHINIVVEWYFVCSDKCTGNSKHPTRAGGSSGENNPQRQRLYLKKMGINPGRGLQYHKNVQGVAMGVARRWVWVPQEILEHPGIRRGMAALYRRNGIIGVAPLSSSGPSRSDLFGETDLCRQHPTHSSRPTRCGTRPCGVRCANGLTYDGVSIATKQNQALNFACKSLAKTMCTAPKWALKFACYVYAIHTFHITKFVCPLYTMPCVYQTVNACVSKILPCCILGDCCKAHTRSQSSSRTKVIKPKGQSIVKNIHALSIDNDNWNKNIRQNQDIQSGSLQCPVSDFPSSWTKRLCPSGKSQYRAILEDLGTNVWGDPTPIIELCDNCIYGVVRGPPFSGKI